MNFELQNSDQINLSDPIQRCNNEGGQDVSLCSSYTLPQRDGIQETDVVCGTYKPLLRHCHVPAMNGPSNQSHFEFSRHDYFTAETARSVCQDVGGSLPNLNEELDSIWLDLVIKHLGNFVSVGWPFSAKWMTWPVHINRSFCRIERDVVS